LGDLCHCPIYVGQELPPAQSDSSPFSSPELPAAAIPALSINPGATAKLYLDFDGDFQASWGAWSNITTPAFDTNGDPSTFSAGEIAAIQETWARVAEDYAPFNIDVITIDLERSPTGWQLRSSSGAMDRGMAEQAAWPMSTASPTATRTSALPLKTI
jgi:hypothetical protein